MGFKFNPLTLNFDLVSDVGDANDIAELQAEVDAIQASIGANDGIATLDNTGKVPASQLPSYVDDVIEVDDFATLPITGETGKIYITLDTNKTYRWTGSTYVEISSSPENSVVIFDASTSWTPVADEYVLSIPAATHLKGTNPQVQILENDGSDFAQVIVYTAITADGDIVIIVPQSPDNRFAGKAIIS